MKKVFIAYDGNSFETEKACYEYEVTNCPEYRKMCELAKEFKELCKKCNCSTCPFLEDTGICLFDDKPKQVEIEKLEKLIK